MAFLAHLELYILSPLPWLCLTRPSDGKSKMSLLIQGHTTQYTPIDPQTPDR